MHFVQDWALKSYMLALKHITKSHTSDNLLLSEVINHWNISDKVVTISADDAHNIKKVSLIIK